MQRGMLYLRNLTLGKAWRSWMSFHATCARRRILTAKCVGRLRNVVAGHAWASWWDLIALKREKAAKVAVAAAHWNKLAQGKAWRAMRDDFLWRQEVKRMAKRWMNPLRAKALAGACAFLRPPPLACPLCAALLAPPALAARPPSATSHPFTPSCRARCAPHGPPSLTSRFPPPTSAPQAGATARRGPSACASS